jgi:hypothetical protein
MISKKHRATAFLGDAVRGGRATAFWHRESHGTAVGRDGPMMSQRTMRRMRQGVAITLSQ